MMRYLLKTPTGEMAVESCAQCPLDPCPQDHQTCSLYLKLAQLKGKREEYKLLTNVYTQALENIEIEIFSLEGK